LKQYYPTEITDSLTSPPARGRGLKHGNVADKLQGDLSPPARGRGLKQGNVVDHDKFARVAPRAGAWIETCHSRAVTSPSESRPPRGGVD